MPERADVKPYGVALAAAAAALLGVAGCSGDPVAPTPPGDTAAAVIGAPGWSPSISGSRVVWAEPIEGAPAIVLFDLETGETRRIARGPDRLDEPSIDGSTVVWKEGIGESRQIAVGDASGTPKILIGSDSEPEFWPDVSGNHVVWARVVDGTERLVVLHDLETGRDTVLGEGVFLGNPPRIDGDRVVWSGRSRSPPERDSQVRLYDIPSKTLEVVSLPEGGAQPDISGDRVVWQGRDAIVLFDLATRELREITDDDSVRPRFPRIDGDIVVWVEVRNDRLELIMYDISTDQRTRLTGEGSDVVDFVFSHAVSGRRVVWQESVLSRRAPSAIMLLELP